MTDHNETMVKAEVGERVNDAIEALQEQYDLNKKTATRDLLRMGTHAFENKHLQPNGSGSHRLAGAEPSEVPADAPRNEDGDPEEL